MVRIHVVRASRLLLGAGIAVLLAVVLWLAGRALLGGEETGESPRMDRNVYVGAETEAAFVSASAVFALPKEITVQVTPEKADKPARVLIYHTHTHEAYKKTEQDSYVETAVSRTKDNGHNVVRVGEALAELLTERGFTVIHDETDHEQNALGTAYERSLKTAQSYVGDVDVFIDLHRDAYSKNGSGNPFCVEIDGVKTARLMFLVGNGKGFDEKPYYAENYGLATRLTHRINEAHEGLCRPVMVKDGRYNQNVSTRALLVEVGHNENSLEQALAALPYLADALRDVLLTEGAA